MASRIQSRSIERGGGTSHSSSHSSTQSSSRSSSRSAGHSGSHSSTHSSTRSSSRSGSHSATHSTTNSSTRSSTRSGSHSSSESQTRSRHSETSQPLVTTNIVKGPSVSVENVNGSLTTATHYEDISIQVSMKIPVKTGKYFSGTPS